MKARLLALVAFTCLAAVNRPAGAQAVEVAKLLDMAPIIDKNHPHHSYKIAGHLNFGLGLNWEFQLAKDGDAENSFIVWDALDKTPLIFCSSGRALVYDPIHSQLILVAASAVRFKLIGENDRVSFDYAIVPGVRLVTYDIQFDLKSLLKANAQPESFAVEKVSDTLRRLKFLTSKGNIGSAIIAPAERSPYRMAEVRTKEGNQVLMHLYTMSIDEKVEPDAFTFPDIAELNKKVSVVTRDANTIDEARRTASDISYVGARFAMQAPEMHSAIEKTTGKLDWESIKQRDIEISRVLRESIKAQPASGPVDVVKSMTVPAN